MSSTDDPFGKGLTRHGYSILSTKIRIDIKVGDNRVKENYPKNFRSKCTTWEKMKTENNKDDDDDDDDVQIKDI